MNPRDIGRTARPERARKLLAGGARPARIAERIGARRDWVYRWCEPLLDEPMRRRDRGGCRGAA